MVIILVAFVTVGMALIAGGLYEGWDEIDVPSFKRRPRWDDQFFGKVRGDE